MQKVAQLKIRCRIWVFHVDIFCKPILFGMFYNNCNFSSILIVNCLQCSIYINPILCNLIVRLTCKRCLCRVRAFWDNSVEGGGGRFYKIFAVSAMSILCGLNLPTICNQLNNNSCFPSKYCSVIPILTDEVWPLFQPAVRYTLWFTCNYS